MAGPTAFLTALATGAFALAVLGLAACDDDPQPEPPAPTESAEPGPGVVQAQPDDGTRVNVILREWAILIDVAEVDAGRIYFLVENTGPDDPHEFLVIRIGDAELADIPVVDGRVPEDEIDFVDEIEPFTVGSSASIVIDLPPGKYLLLCNIAEVEDGELESHYELGMRTRFNVR